MASRRFGRESLAGAEQARPAAAAAQPRAVLTREVDRRPSSLACRTVSPVVTGRQRAAAAMPVMHAEAVEKSYDTVGDVMTTGIMYSCSPKTTVLEALEMIVEHRITGLPVLDDDNKVVGVVSDFDLLALDVPSLKSMEIFPTMDQSWQTFLEVRKLVNKVSGKIVEDVMSYDPLVVRATTSLDAAARLLLESKARRLPVVDKDGKLIGMLSRRDIVVAALHSKKANADETDGFGETLKD